MEISVFSKKYSAKNLLHYSIVFKNFIKKIVKLLYFIYILISRKKLYLYFFNEEKTIIFCFVFECDDDGRKIFFSLIFNRIVGCCSNNFCFLKNVSCYYYYVLKLCFHFLFFVCVSLVKFLGFFQVFVAFEAF